MYYQGSQCEAFYFLFRKRQPSVCPPCLLNHPYSRHPSTNSVIHRLCETKISIMGRGWGGRQEPLLKESFQLLLCTMPSSIVSLMQILFWFNFTFEFHLAVDFSFSLLAELLCYSVFGGPLLTSLLIQRQDIISSPSQSWFRPKEFFSKVKVTSFAYFQA
jgi:hypothetical protein